jgi:hypothetical protein
LPQIASNGRIDVRNRRVRLVWAAAAAAIFLPAPTAVAASGHAWSQALQVPAPANKPATAPAVLEGIACPSNAWCVAVGAYETSSHDVLAMLETDRNGSWRFSDLASPANAGANPRAELFGVTCTTAQSCVAVGTFTDNSGSAQALLAVERGTSWTASELRLPSDAASNPKASLRGVACATAANCVAVGNYTDTAGRGQALVATDANGKWTAIEVSPTNTGASPGAFLAAVSCPRANACTAVGGVTTNSSGSGFAIVATELSGAWTATQLIEPGNAFHKNRSAALEGIACSAPGNCAAGGQYLVNETNGSVEYEALEATEAKGAWSSEEVVAPPYKDTSSDYGTLFAFACPPSRPCFAVGSYQAGGSDGPGFRAMTATATNGRWTMTTVGAPPDARHSTSDQLDAVGCVPGGASCVAVGSYDNGSRLMAATSH